MLIGRVNRSAIATFPSGTDLCGGEFDLRRVADPARRRAATSIDASRLAHRRRSAERPITNAQPTSREPQES